MAVPVPGPGEILVRVDVAALNPLDIKLHRGERRWYFDLALPYTMGTDLAGTVEKVGERVEGFTPGMAVVGWCPPLMGGAFAEYAVVVADFAAALPEALPVSTAAAIPTAAGTAHHALFDIGKLSAGQTVLVHAGAGGVGMFAIQLAKSAGACVIATASGDGVDLCLAFGADKVIDYRRTDFSEAVSDCDLVLDSIGGETQGRSYPVLKPGGQLISLLEAPDEAIAKSWGVTGSRAYFGMAPGQLADLVDLIVVNGFQVAIDSHFSFGDFAAAMARQASGRVRGKLVLEQQ